MPFIRTTRGLLRSAVRNATTTLTKTDPLTGATVPLIFSEVNVTYGRLILNVTAASGTGGLTVQFRAYDEFQQVAMPIGTGGTAVTAVGQYFYELSPSVTAASGNLRETFSRVLPKYWDAIVTHGDSSNYTYSLTFEGS